MAVYSDKTNKNGLVQRFEFWTRLKDGTIDHASPSTLAYQVADRINAGFEKIMPLLLSYSDHIRWDDLNHGDRPIGTIDIVSGQSDYTITTDDNSLDILNFTGVKILASASATEYDDIEKLTLDDPRVLEAMSPSPSQTGTPYAYVENGNDLFFLPQFDYSKTDGIKLYFSREHSYFAASDSTKEAGIPKPFHELLVLHAANDWLAVNRSEDASLRAEVRGQINRLESDLQSFIDLRNPTKLIIKPKGIRHR